MTREQIKAMNHFLKDLEITQENLEMFVDASRDQLNKLKRTWRDVKKNQQHK